MLVLEIPAQEVYSESEGMFIEIPKTKLRLEHSLVSLSKWEAIWKKPFLDTSKPKTEAETIDYIKCMTITQNVDPKVYACIGQDIVDKVNEYIEDPQTATTIHDRHHGGKKEIITAELIYYWMTLFNIPMECQKWHLNRLFTLLQICAIKQSGGKKMSKNEILAQNRALNNARRKAMRTRG